MGTQIEILYVGENGHEAGYLYGEVCDTKQRLWLSLNCIRAAGCQCPLDLEDVAAPPLPAIEHQHLSLPRASSSLSYRQPLTECQSSSKRSGHDGAPVPPPRPSPDAGPRNEFLSGLSMDLARTHGESLTMFQAVACASFSWKFCVRMGDERLRVRTYSVGPAPSGPRGNSSNQCLGLKLISEVIDNIFLSLIL